MIVFAFIIISGVISLIGMISMYKQLFCKQKDDE